ncbi:hypothetical protein Tco_0059320 [Tanacetum coccineum]
MGRLWRCKVNGKYDFKKNLYLFSWEGRRIVMVSPKVIPQLPKPEVKVEEKIVKAEVVDEHIEKIQELQNYKEHEDKILTLLFETTNKVGTLNTYEEIMGFNDDEDVKGFNYSSYLACSQTETSQSRQHDKSESTYIKDLSEHFNINYAFLVSQKKLIRFCVFDLLNGVPELLHENFKNFSRDGKCLEAGRVLDDINHDLKCLFLLLYCSLQSQIDDADLDSFFSVNPLFIMSSNLKNFLWIHDSA